MASASAVYASRATLPSPMQDSLPAGGLRLCREGVEPSGSLRKVSGSTFHSPFQGLACRKVIYAKPPFAGPEQVLDHVSRYTHRVAISNNRLVAIKDGKVAFRWKDYRHGSRQKVMTVAADEFIRRFLLHVLPEGFHRIRYYGFLRNRYRAQKLAHCRDLLSMPVPEPSDGSSERDYRDRYEDLIASGNAGPVVKAR